MIGDPEVVVVAGEKTMLPRAEHRKTVLLAAVFGAFLLVGNVAPTVARDRNSKCRERIHKAEAKLRYEIERHGEHSRQAQAVRHSTSVVAEIHGEFT
jgi:anti-sigma factor ChrR (cupin superfamily)